MNKIPPIKVTVNEADRALIETAAKSTGLSLSAWSRLHLLDAAKERLQMAAKAMAFIDERQETEGRE